MAIIDFWPFETLLPSMGRFCVFSKPGFRGFVVAGGFGGVMTTLVIGEECIISSSPLGGLGTSIHDSTKKWSGDIQVGCD